MHVRDGIREGRRKFGRSCTLGSEIGHAIDRAPGALIHGEGMESHRLKPRSDLAILTAAPTSLMK